MSDTATMTSACWGGRQHRQHQIPDSLREEQSFEIIHANYTHPQHQHGAPDG